jgi:hypothetical protein
MLTAQNKATASAPYRPRASGRQRASGIFLGMLDGPSLSIYGASGTSAETMNAAVLVHGYAAGGNAGGAGSFR